MQLSDILHPTRVAVQNGMAPPMRTKEQVLHKLAELLAKGAKLDPGLVEEGLNKREKLHSTGVGGGVAIPHAFVDGLPQIVGAVLLCREPIGFDAIDGAPVSIFFAVIAPRSQTGEHIKTLARVSRVLRDDGFRERLVDAASGDLAFDLIAREEGRTHS